MFTFGKIAKVTLEVKKLEVVTIASSYFQFK